MIKIDWVRRLERDVDVGHPASDSVVVKAWIDDMHDKYSLNKNNAKFWLPILDKTVTIQKAQKRMPSWCEEALKYQLETLNDQVPKIRKRVSVSTNEWKPHESVQKWIDYQKECWEMEKKGAEAKIYEFGNIESMKKLREYYEVTYPQWFDRRPYGFRSNFEKWRWAKPIFRTAKNEYVFMLNEKKMYIDQDIDGVEDERIVKAMENWPGSFRGKGA